MMIATFFVIARTSSLRLEIKNRQIGTICLFTSERYGIQNGSADHPVGTSENWLLETIQWYPSPLVILLIVAENDGIFKGNCPFAGKFVRLYNFQRPPAKNLVSILYTFCQEAV